ncbi:MAG TPA: LysR substrate-binding domain-containing protein [Actinospica sp.]|nr:LysR substrate-binding domain-containing protein [Actinospica sp.]
MLAGIDTTRLRVFREVARQGSFTAAALALQVSQPAVSQHVARLEQELGCTLLERSSRRVRPTPAGEAFLRRVETLLTELSEASRELAVLANSDRGLLRLAVFPSAAATFVPAAVGVLRVKYPQVTFRLIDADPPQALPLLLAGDVDLAVCYDYPTVAAQPDPRLCTTALAVDRMAVAVPAESPRALDGSPVELSTLAAEPWIVPGPSQCRSALDEACRRAGFRPDIVSETNDYQAMLGLVEAGIGLAVVPRIAAAFARAVRLLPLTGTRLTRVVGVAARAGGARTPAMEFMQATLAETLSELLAAASFGTAGEVPVSDDRARP